MVQARIPITSSPFDAALMRARRCAPASRGGAGRPLAATNVKHDLSRPLTTLFFALKTHLA